MKNKVFKCLLACALSVSLIGSLLGCGATSNESDVQKTEEVKGTEDKQSVEGSSEQRVEPQTLKVMWWGSQERADATSAMCDLFEEKHPGVTVEIEFTDFGGYYDKLSTQAVSNSLPDVFQLGSDRLVQYVNSGTLADLTAYMADGAIDVSTAPESLITAGVVDGKNYAIPTGCNAPVFAYRQDVLDECELVMPEKLTWDVYLEMCEIIHEKTGRQSHVASAVLVEQLEYYLNGFGLKVYSEDGAALGFDETKYLVTMWEKGLHAIEKGYAPGVGESTAGDEIFAEEIWSGIFWSNHIEDLEIAGNCSLELAELPWVEEGANPSGYLQPTMYWCVGETSEVKDLATEFLDFFLNDTEVYEIVGVDRGVPVTAESKELMASKVEGTQKKVMEIISYLGQPGMTSNFVVPHTSAAAEVIDLLAQTTERVFYGAEADLEKAAQEWMDKANEILARAASK